MPARPPSSFVRPRPCAVAPQESRSFESSVNRSFAPSSASTSPSSISSSADGATLVISRRRRGRLALDRDQRQAEAGAQLQLLERLADERRAAPASRRSRSPSTARCSRARSGTTRLWATRMAMSRSGKMTRVTPSRSRIRPCSVVTALAMMRRHAEVLHLHHHQQAGLDVLADRDDRARRRPARRPSRSALTSVASSCAACDTTSAMLRTRSSSESMPMTSWPSSTSVEAMAEPKRPSPMTQSV